VKIAIAGTGYVGLSNAVLLAQHNEVVCLDLLPEKVEKINRRQSVIDDPEITEFLAERPLHLSATLDPLAAYANADFIIVSTPTDYDPEKNYFDTRSVEDVVQRALKINLGAVIIIKSTVPVGYTEKLREKYGVKNIIFSPEFLREGRALFDNLHPSRIIVGERSERAKVFAELLQQGAKKKNIPTLYTGSTEAEAIKLFANAFLAMRVSFFNELDTYAAHFSLESRQIIDGVCLDPRIGSHYNNPSFGYGGYCLPKDTKQLLANFTGVPQSIISAIVESNSVRKDFLASEVERLFLARRSSNAEAGNSVGVYRLVMKAGSDNYRESAVQGVITRLVEKGINVLVYEPFLAEENYLGALVTHSVSSLKSQCQVILANRMTPEIEDVASVVFTRDLYNTDT
jgi:UDPglucose 6-dehydrogenase